MKLKLRNKEIPLFFLAEVLSAWIILFTIPPIVPSNSDVVGGFILFEYPNLNYIVFFVVNILVIPALLIRQLKLSPIASPSGVRIRKEATYDKNFLAKLLKIVIDLYLACLLLIASINLSNRHMYGTDLIGQIKIVSKSSIWFALALLFSLLVLKKVRGKIHFFDILGIIPPVLIFLIIKLAILPYYVMASNGTHFLRILNLSPFVFLIISYFFLKKKNESEVQKFFKTIGISSFIFMNFSNVVTQITFHPFESYPYANVFQFLNFNYLPWQDLLMNHGFYEDFFRYYLGSIFFANTPWGMATFYALVIQPLEILFVLFCLSKIFNSYITPLFFIGIAWLISGILPGTGFYSVISINSLPRMLPLLLVIIFYLRLRKQERNAHVFLGLALAIALLWSLEGLYIACAVLAMPLANAFLQKNLNRSSAFRQIKDVSISFVYCLIILVSVLTPFGLLKPFFSSIVTQGSGFLFQAGGPIQFSAGIGFALLFAGLPLAMIFSLYKYKVEIGEGKEFLWESLFIATLVSCAYFAKFLIWPDWHLAMASAVFMPVGVLISWQILNRLFILTKTKESQHNLVVIALLPFICFSLFTAFQNLNFSNRITPAMSTIFDKSIGFTTSQEIATRDRQRSLKLEIDQILGQTEYQVLDFTNTPVDNYLFSEFQSPSHLLFVATSFSDNSMTASIEELKTDMPEVVLWQGERGYWNGPLPGATYLRNYRFTEFILDNFSPVSENGGYIIFLRNDLNPSISGSAVQRILNLDCNWYSGLNYFNYKRQTSNLSFIEMNPTELFSLTINNESQTDGFLNFIDDQGQVVGSIGIGRYATDSLLISSETLDTLDSVSVNIGATSSILGIKEFKKNRFGLSLISEKVVSPDRNFFFSKVSQANPSVIQLESVLEGNYEVIREGSVGVTKFTLKNSQTVVDVPLSTCPSWRHYAGANKIKSGFIISTPKEKKKLSVNF
jgi:hypothetical protein